MDDLVSKLSEMRSEYNCFDEDEEPKYRALSEAIKILSQRAEARKMDDLIRRVDAIALASGGCHPANLAEELAKLPSAQPEQLTDKEQRIFLAAMAREEKVCEEVDRDHVREPYEDSLMRVCKEIKRKVKCALWT